MFVFLLVVFFTYLLTPDTSDIDVTQKKTMVNGVNLSSMFTWILAVPKAP